MMKPELRPSDPVSILDSFRAEELVGQWLHATVVENLDEQRADIDLRDARGTTYSVKYQKTAYRTGNFSFEVLQATEDRSKTVPGNFSNCRADRYALVSPLDGTTLDLLVVDAAKLKTLVADPKYRKTWLNPRGVEENRRRGNKYVHAQSVLVPRGDVLAITDPKDRHVIELEVR